MVRTPIRSAVEGVTSRVPKGPLGFFGEGNAVGAAGFTAVGVANTFIPIDGVRVGYRIQSHSISRQKDANIHTFVINAASRDVARFAAKLNAAPSNVDFFARETDITDIDRIEKRRTFSTFRVKVKVDQREAVEDMV